MGTACVSSIPILYIIKDVNSFRQAFCMIMIQRFRCIFVRQADALRCARFFSLLMTGKAEKTVYEWTFKSIYPRIAINTPYEIVMDYKRGIA